MIAGNKDDLYGDEEVEENEAKDLADSLKAIFQKTSAKSANGIEDLFVKIGKRFLNPKGDETTGEGGYKATKPEKSLLKSLNVKSSPIHENKSTFIVAMSDIIVPTIPLHVVVT